jgi:hypothetical protein
MGTCPGCSNGTRKAAFGPHRLLLICAKLHHQETCAGKCADLAGEVAAALAHAALAFKEWQDLSMKYWDKANQAFKQVGDVKTLIDNGQTSQIGISSNQFPLLQNYYKSSSPWSHVYFAAASMWVACKSLSFCTATEAAGFKDLAISVSSVVDNSGPRWYWELAGWDNAWWDATVLMAQQGESGPMIDGNVAYTHFLSVFVNRWVNVPSETTDSFSPLRCVFAAFWRFSQPYFYQTCCAHAISDALNLQEHHTGSFCDKHHCHRRRFQIAH